MTEPLTFPPIHYGAYRVVRVLRWTGNAAELTKDQVVALAENATSQADPQSWSFIHILLPLAIGLVVFAVVSTMAGFLLARLVWTIPVRKRWLRRIDARRLGKAYRSAPGHELV